MLQKIFLMEYLHSQLHAVAAGGLRLAAKRTLRATGEFATSLALAGTSLETTAAGRLNALSVNGEGTLARHFIIYIQKKI